MSHELALALPSLLPTKGPTGFAAEREGFMKSGAESGAAECGTTLNARRTTLVLRFEHLVWGVREGGAGERADLRSK